MAAAFRAGPVKRSFTESAVAPFPVKSVNCPQCSPVAERKTSTLKIFSHSGPASHTAASSSPSFRGAVGTPPSREQTSDTITRRCDVNNLTDEGGGQLSFPAIRRRGLLLSTLAPFLTTLEGFRAFDVAAAAEEEGVLLETIRNEVAKAVSKGKAAGVLRLVFHDAGTYNLGTKQGGMNGSIIYELERPESAGLKRSVRVLEKIRANLEPGIIVSWADLIAVAGAESVAICGGPRINISLGRLDSSAPDPEGEMPEETLNATELKKCFRLKGFSTQEMIALSGAHTIGNKGFGAPDIFDNTYYQTLIDKPWVSDKGNNMTSMIGLASDRNLTDDDECMKWVKLYAENQDRFFSDFSAAYLKLVSTGVQWA